MRSGKNYFITFHCNVAMSEQRRYSLSSFVDSTRKDKCEMALNFAKASPSQIFSFFFNFFPQFRRNMSNAISLSNFIRVFQTFSYLFGYSPFYFSFKGTGQSKSASAKSWLPQKIICALLSISGSVWLIAEVFPKFPKTSSSEIRSIHPSLYFQFFFALVSSANKILTFKHMWEGRKVCAGIVNLILKSESKELEIEAGWVSTQSSRKHPIPYKNRDWTLKWLPRKAVVFIICSLYTGMALETFISGSGLLPASQEIISNYENQTLSRLFIWAERIKVTLHFLLPVTSHFPDFLVIIFGIFAFFQRRMSGLFTDLSILIPTLTLWTCSKKLSNSLEEFDIKWSEVKRRYLNLKQCSHLINKWIGNRFTLIVIGVVTYYSTRLGEAFILWRKLTSLNSGETEAEQKAAAQLQFQILKSLFYVAFFLIQGCVIFYCAADVTLQVSVQFARLIIEIKFIEFLLNS